MHRFDSCSDEGLSLLEIAIVLVVTGILVGGAVAGMHLMRAAELRSIAEDIQHYKTLVKAFHIKYGDFPGDMPTATAQWGRADGGADVTQNCANPETDSMLGPPTCNGDGNGKIDDNGIEQHRFWEHLSAARMIEGDFTGVQAFAGGPGDTVTPGVNAPASRIKGVGWFVRYFINTGTGEGCLLGYAVPRFDGCYGNNFEIGRAKVGDDPQAPFLTGPEARGIDLKYDDGKPAKGSIFAALWPVCTDAADQADVTADYVTDDETAVCALSFLNVF